MTVNVPFRDKVEAHEAAKMPAEYQTLLKRVLRIQADCEIGGPHLYVNQSGVVRYSYWGAANAESAIVD